MNLLEGSLGPISDVIQRWYASDSYRDAVHEGGVTRLVV